MIRIEDFLGDSTLFAVVFLVLATLSHPVLRPRLREISHLQGGDSLLGGGPHGAD